MSASFKRNHHCDSNSFSNSSARVHGVWLNKAFLRHVYSECDDDSVF